MAEVRVTRAGEGRFEVEVSEGASRTRHEVAARDEDVRRYGGEASPERLLAESFRFLLEREPKESILRRFDLPAIERYFPEYPREIRKRLA
jgi:hypothetical protein